MQDFLATNQWPLLTLVVFLVGATAQVIKFLVKSITRRNLGVQNLVSYGGMPSSHAAFVAGLLTVMGIHQGWNSPEVAISFVFGLLVLRDALGLRNYVDRAMEDVKKIGKKMSGLNLQSNTLADLQVGHTRAEVVVGLLVGVVFGLFYHWVIFALLG